MFEEYGLVSVSQDGTTFVDLPYDPVSHSGLAGRVPVLTNPDNDIDPLDPTVSGGDAYDLADVGLSWVAYVRITDPGAAITDPGDRIPPGDKGGFDLDASRAARLRSIWQREPDADVHPDGHRHAAVGCDRDRHCDSDASRNPIGDVDGDASSASRTAPGSRELFDGDGDERAAAAGGTIASGPEADVNDDGLVTARGSRRDRSASALMRGRGRRMRADRDRCCSPPPRSAPRTSRPPARCVARGRGHRRAAERSREARADRLVREVDVGARDKALDTAADALSEARRCAGDALRRSRRLLDDLDPRVRESGARLPRRRAARSRGSDRRPLHLPLDSLERIDVYRGTIPVDSAAAASAAS